MKLPMQAWCDPLLAQLSAIICFRNLSDISFLYSTYSKSFAPPSEAKAGKWHRSSSSEKLEFCTQAVHQPSPPPPKAFLVCCFRLICNIYNCYKSWCFGKSVAIMKHEDFAICLMLICNLRNGSRSLILILTVQITKSKERTLYRIMNCLTMKAKY